MLHFTGASLAARPVLASAKGQLRQERRFACSSSEPRHAAREGERTREPKLLKPDKAGHLQKETNKEPARQKPPQRLLIANQLRPQSHPKAWPARPRRNNPYRPALRAIRLPPSSAVIGAMTGLNFVEAWLVRIFPIQVAADVRACCPTGFVGTARSGVRARPSSAQPT
jgi:hypothetical protein